MKSIASQFPRDRILQLYCKDNLSGRETARTLGCKFSTFNKYLRVYGIHKRKEHRKIRRCEIEGCENKHAARGYCKMHHLRWWKYGSPHTRRIVILHGTLKERLYGRIEKAESGCWLWTGSKLKRKGREYGQIRVNGKTSKAHAVSYKIHKGEIPKGLWVLHSCDNPSCVNPEHLWLGTAKDNTADMYEKGRARPGGRSQANAR